MNDSKENLMTNLKIPLAKPWFDGQEAEVAAKIVKSRWLIFGKETEKFEEEFALACAAKYAVAVNSGSSALLVAMAALGVSAGDEVIVPDMTFVSTASAAMFLGAIPVFADIELKTYCIDPNKIEKLIGPKTKAIVPVHYAGQTAEMDKILEIARKHKLFILEDAAESHLSEYKGKKCGTLGDMGIFSFTPSKPMTTGEGGMIVTNNEELAKRARLIKNFGDTDKFRWEILGFNFRMPEVMGAIGRVQLKKLNQAIKMRREIATKYTAGLSGLEGIITPFVRDMKDHNFQLYTIRLNPEHLKVSRDEFIALLLEKGVSSRLYYPALHDQKVFCAFKQRNNNNFSLTQEFANTALSLPIYPELTDNEINYVVDIITQVVKKNKR
ncbi:MAG: DegT/DnrJ/EryC1/StrS family aminotransferase [Candidatus Omnitrophica bacterium]|nr:DegT/DnrJ/EryC1/StrS family aminotransferase [Candidatus Omnitrophota bacterium]